MSTEENLSAEIDAAVEEVNAEAREVQEAGEAQEERDGDEQAQETSVDKSEKQEDEPESSGDDTAELSDEQEADEGDDSESPSLQEISDAALTRAVRAGYSVEEARAFGSEEALNIACARTEQVDRDWRDKAKDVQDDEKQEQEDEEAEDPLEAFDNLSDDFEPEVKQLLGAMANEIRSQRTQISELRAGYENTAHATQQAAAQEVEAWFDGQIEGLGDDFKESLGVGGYRSLTPGSPQLAKRDAIAEQITVMLSGYQAAGRPVPPREDVFRQAVSLVLRDELASIERKKLDKNLRDRSKRHIQRAEGHGAKDMTGITADEEIAGELDTKFFGKDK